MNTLKGNRYLFLFAHPDDDVFISGTMRTLLDRGAHVFGAWATSGGLLGGSTSRETELARAMRILELPQSRMHLLRFPDLGLVRNMSSACDRVAELLQHISPDTVFVTAFEGGHPDHDSLNFIAYEARRRAGLSPGLFEYPLYNGSGSFLHWRWRINRFPPGGPAPQATILNDDAISRKHRMMMTYSSQWLYMIPARLASSATRLRTRGEPYRRCPDERDHAVPPHGGKLNYERWFNAFMRIRFIDFREAMLSVRESPRNTAQRS